VCRVKPAEIDQQTHHTLVETVSGWPHAGVHDLTDIERGGCHPILRSRFVRVNGALFRGLREFRWKRPPWHAGTERLGDRQPRAEAVLMETIAGPCPAEPGVAASLNVRQTLLRCKSSGRILRMLADVFAESELRL